MKEVDGYVLRSELGRGGMATVYLAQEVLTQRLVALKLLRWDLARSEDARRRFIAEMHILARLEHPNVVRCHHCNDVDGQLLMALEYVPGGTLRALLDARVRLEPPEACRIALGVLAALCAAHTHQPPIIHRDLKPENILLGSDGTIKVADFGIAKMLGSKTMTTTPLGTLHYMSPEQIEEHPIDARSDLYSLGIVLYEMLAGRRPFEGRSAMELIRAHYGQPPPPLPAEVVRATPPQLVELVLALLRKDPSTRPPSAAAVHAQLARMLAPAPAYHASPPPSASPPPPAGPPRPITPMPPLDTVDLIDAIDRPRSAGRGSRLALHVAAGVLVLLGTGALVSLGIPALLRHLGSAPEAAGAQGDAASVVAAVGADVEPATASPLPTQPPPPGSARSRVSQFLQAKDPGGPVPVHPELQLSDYTVKVMVRNDLVEAQRGARIVADAVVDGARPRVQIIRRPRNGRTEHWVLVGRYRSRTAAMRAKAGLRPILNQGANHLQLSDACAELGPLVDGLRDCVPQP